MSGPKRHAIAHVDGALVATGSTYRECSDKAMAAMPWGTDPRGEVAPHYLTSAPVEQMPLLLEAAK